MQNLKRKEQLSFLTKKLKSQCQRVRMKRKKHVQKIKNPSSVLSKVYLNISIVNGAMPDLKYPTRIAQEDIHVHSIMMVLIL
jgi:hypothetical protein